MEAGEHPAGVQPGHKRWEPPRGGMHGQGGSPCRRVPSPQPCPVSPPPLPSPGSPKRRQFQRQRAASESMDQEDRDPHQTDIIQYIARTDDVAFHPAGGPFLPSPASPPPSLGRYFSVDRGDGDGDGRAGHGEGAEGPRAALCMGGLPPSCGFGGGWGQLVMGRVVGTAWGTVWHHGTAAEPVGAGLALPLPTAGGVGPHPRPRHDAGVVPTG